MKGYEYLARLLKAYGTTHVFYQEQILVKTLEEASRLGIKPILAHSEFAAGYMADGYARIKKMPGVCFAQAIGAANLAASINDAWLGTTPVIAITGRKPHDYQYRNAYQESPHHFFFEGLTKMNEEIHNPETLPFFVRQAFREAVTGKPRPVHLEILGFTGIVQEEVDIEEEFSANPEFSTYPAMRQEAPAEKVEQVAKAIDAAERPVFVLGRGAMISDAGQEILKIAEANDIWITTTPDAKTIMDESHALWAGIVGNYGMDCANRIVLDSDLVIYIGTQVSDQTTLDWSVPPRSAKTVQIDIDPAELGRNYTDCIGLVGDAKMVAAQLASVMKEKKRESWIQKGNALISDTFEKQEKMWKDSSNPIKTNRLCKEISDILPDDAILVSDTGWSAVWSATMIRMKESQSYIRAAGSLGWSFPASLGAKCAAPDRPVVCFTGDGGFLYLNTEMETAARYGINTVTVINNNGLLAQCVPSAAYVYDNIADTKKSRTFTPVSFARIAEEYGLLGIQVDKAEDIAPALEKALAAGKPAVVEVLTDGDNNSPLYPLEK